MDWEKIYQQKLMTAEEAVDRLVKDNDTIGIGGQVLASAPINALFAKVKAGNLKGITLIGDLLVDPLPLDDPDITPEKLSYKSVFFGGHERRGYAQGKVFFIPTQFNNYTKIIQKIRPRVAILPFAPPDEQGYANIGPINACLNPVVIESCDILIGQMNKNMPYGCGHESLKVPVGRFDAVVEVDQPIPEFATAEISDIDRKVADYILDMIPDGATIQLGLGGMANAIGYGLKDKKHLGVHTEMYTESMAYLTKIGVIDNSRKTFMPGVSVAGFVLGSKDLYEYCNNNEGTYFGPFSFVNNVTNIMKNGNMIFINNALEVDLYGQVCSEGIGFRHFSGTGGQVDYVRGAVMSNGGKSFIALPSTYTDKSGNVHSKIVLNFSQGTSVTTLRSDVQYIVTEYGCVDLFGEDLVTRAKKLISIAHPQFRDELMSAAKKNNLIY
jgi:4-hydroxybutyrate CoA-transferase